ncbi:hypothetical protein ACIQJV_35110, partial [Streptomyces californicus]
APKLVATVNEKVQGANVRALHALAEHAWLGGATLAGAGTTPPTVVRPGPDWNYPRRRGDDTC